jgi:hypothetical protein
MDLGLLEHVAGKMQFKDGNYYYRLRVHNLSHCKMLCVLLASCHSTSPTPLPLFLASGGHSGIGHVGELRKIGFAA